MIPAHDHAVYQWVGKPRASGDDPGQVAAVGADAL